MPLLLLVPFLVAGVVVLWLLLMPLAIVQRYRHGTSRRRVQPWVVRVNAWLLLVSAVAFVAVAAVLGNWIDDALRDALVGLAVGGGVGVIGLSLDRFEVTSHGMFRTPNRWLVLGLSLLLAARIVAGLWLAWQDGDTTGETAWLTRGGLIGVGGVLVGYALATAWGLRRRVRIRPRFD